MRFRIDSVDNTRYITIPFDLFSHPKYAGLDAMTKLIYGFLKSRMNLSKMNNWVDENGDVFFFMQLDELAKYIGTVKSTISKKLSILEQVGLLERHSCTESRSHKMYLHQVEAAKEEVQARTSVTMSNTARSISYKQNSNSVSCGKLNVSADEIEVSYGKSRVSPGKPIYNNKIQEKNIKSINNNRKIYPANADVENFDKPVSEPLEPIGKFFRSIGMAAHTVEKILVKYTPERLWEVIDILKMQTDVRNRAGFIVAALKSNYQLSGNRCPNDKSHRDFQIENTENKKQCRYVVAERPEFVATPEVISGVINTIEMLFKRDGKILSIYENWLASRGLTLVDGKVVNIA